MGARVGVVIVHFKHSDLTARSVASVEASTYCDFTIQVIDNDEINRGFAGGANEGIRTVLADPRVQYVLVLNNDVWLDSEALGYMAKAAQEKNVDMAAPVVLKASDGSIDRVGLRLNSAWLGFNRVNLDDGDIFCPSGCAALYSRELLEAVEQDGQYFDEDFFMYGEDMDLGLRARVLGFECAVAEKATVWHEESAAADKAAALYLGHRNNVWYIAKNAGLKHFWQWPAILAGQAASLAWLTLRGDGKIIWKAKYDALKGLPKMWRKRELSGIILS